MIFGRMILGHTESFWHMTFELLKIQDGGRPLFKYFQKFKKRHIFYFYFCSTDIVDTLQKSNRSDINNTFSLPVDTTDTYVPELSK